MASVIFDEEFPCGYRYTFEGKLDFFSMGHFEGGELLKICPMHGKKCRKESKR